MQSNCLSRLIGYIVLLSIGLCLMAGLLGNLTNLPWKWLVGAAVGLAILAEIVALIGAKDTMSG